MNMTVNMQLGSSDPSTTLILMNFTRKPVFVSTES